MLVHKLDYDHRYVGIDAMHWSGISLDLQPVAPHLGGMSVTLQVAQVLGCNLFCL